VIGQVHRADFEQPTHAQEGRLLMAAIHHLASASALPAAGVEGNARLTSATGMLLLMALAAEGSTILSVRRMITLHVFLGILLIGPVLLKTGSTMYRFWRYYTGAPPYVAKGPPHPLLRLLGPLVIVASLALLGTGVALLTVKPGQTGLLLPAHKASFVIWFALMAVHVLGHLKDAAVTSWQELRKASAGPANRRRGVRLALIALSLVLGVATATALMPAAAPWTASTARPSDR
jgi:hypothetical protein